MSEETYLKLPVHIRRECDVDNEVVNLRKSKGDEMIWHSEGDEFVVEFPISPFAKDRFVVPAGGSINSGPIRPDAKLTVYRYNIENAALAMSADRDVNVKR